MDQQTEYHEFQAEGNYSYNPHYDNQESSSYKMGGAADDSRLGLHNSNSHINSYNKNRMMSYDDSMLIGDSIRMNRVTLAEAAIRQEMFKECTFRPQIKQLPSSYGGMKDNGAPFHTRVTKWSRDKEAEIRKKTALVERNEVAECTFRPKISRNSERAVKEIRGNLKEDVSDRLYKSSSIYAEQRFRLIEEERQKEDNLEKSQCTFKPKLITKKFNECNNVNAKFTRVQNNKQFTIDHHTKDPNNKECTFTPHINKIKPNMNSAKLYVSANVVERLTRPISSNNNDPVTDESLRAFDNTDPFSSNRSVMDVASYLNNLNNPSTFNTPASTAYHKGKGSDSTENSIGREMSEREVKERQKKFEMFLNRQQTTINKKKEEIQMITKATAPKFKPKLNKKSIQLIESRFGNTDFLQRLNRDLLKRVNSSNENNLCILAADKDLTFQPKISEKSAKMRPRTAFEMSRGDYFRKETNRRMLKLQNDQQELQDLTFQPKLSNYAETVGRSRLQLNSDPSYFLDWYKEKNLDKEISRSLEIKRREEEEIKSCTFNPKTIDCPEYVKRIAKSMSIVKSARNNSSDIANDLVKPDWR